MMKDEKGRFLCGEKHWNWKGEHAKYRAIHVWVRTHKKKVDACEKCNRTGSRLQVANISGEYKRDVNDYKWLCPRCHMEFDGNLEKTIQRNKKGPSDETRRKISANHADVKGEKGSMWGKHHSEESKQKNRVAHLGKKLSEEHKKKISEGLKHFYDNVDVI